MESFFGRGIFGRSITYIQLVPSNWLWRGFINHKRREHVQRRNFIKEGFIKEENTFNEGISLPRSTFLKNQDDSTMDLTELAVAMGSLLFPDQ